MKMIIAQWMWKKALFLHLCNVYTSFDRDIYVMEGTSVPAMHGRLNAKTYLELLGTLCLVPCWHHWQLMFRCLQASGYFGIFLSPPDFHCFGISDGERSCKLMGATLCLSFFFLPCCYCHWFDPWWIIAGIFFFHLLF